jgi:hypothetical protein
LASDYFATMDPADWLRLVCRTLLSSEAGAFIDRVYDTNDVVVRFQRDEDEFTGYAALKHDPRGGIVGGCPVHRIGPRLTSVREAATEVANAIRAARSSRI